MGRKNATAFVFLDTNIFLQFRDFDQIDWLRELGYQRVCLVIAPIILTELESFRYDRESQRRQQRSRKALRDLGEIASTADPGVPASIPNRPGVSLLLLSESPDLSVFPDLRPAVQDDVLLATILQFVGKHPEVDQVDVILVTDDLGLITKARARELRFHRPDDTLRLPDEPTKEQREIEELRAQLAALA